MADRISPVHRVYIVTNSVNGKVYIGITSEHFLSHRWGGHRQRARNGVQTYFYNALRKYGVSSFKIEEIARCHSREESMRLEKFWIGMLRSNQKEFGYNQTCGGEAPKHSEETKRKIGDIGRGRKYTEERLRAQVEFLRRPELQKKRIDGLTKYWNENKESRSGDNHWTRKIGFSEETKRKISEAGKKRWAKARGEVVC